MLLNIDHRPFLNSQSSNDGHGPSNAFSVKEYGIPFDDVHFFEPSQSIGDGPLGYADAFCKSALTDASIFEQRSKEGTVGCVKVHVSTLVVFILNASFRFAAQRQANVLRPTTQGINIHLESQNQWFLSPFLEAYINTQ